MMHRNPQGWFPHCAPSTDDLKMTPITVRLRRPRPFRQLIDRCRALCYVIRHRKEVGPSTQAGGKTATLNSTPMPDSRCCKYAWWYTPALRLMVESAVLGVYK